MRAEAPLGGHDEQQLGGDEEDASMAAASAAVTLPRYSDFGISKSWYRVAWSDEVAPGDVVPLTYFGRELVLYRTEHGEPVVLDAHCQHLGAHLGFGGTVADECIVCPFHGWTWRPDGSNDRIPYETHVVRRRIHPWQVRETLGMIWVWYDQDGGEPTFELPEVPGLSDGTFLPYGADARQSWPNIRVHPLQSVENTADPAHIRFVHGAGVIPTVDDFSAVGAIFSSDLRYVWGAGRERTSLTPDGPVEGVLNANCHGLGLIVTNYSGIWPTVQLTGCTPVDEEHSDYYTAIMVKAGGSPDMHRSILHHFVATVAADFPIWENMVWIEHPPLPRLEARAIRTVRTWSEQFKPNGNSRPGLNSDGPSEIEPE